MDEDIGKKLPREDTVVIAFEKKEETESAIKYLEDHGYRNPDKITVDEIWCDFSAKAIVIRKGELFHPGITVLACWAAAGYRPVSFAEYLSYTAFF